MLAGDAAEQEFAAIVASLRAGQRDLGVRRLVQFVEAHPFHRDGIVLLGCTLLELGGFAHALEMGRRAMRLAPHHSMARFLVIDSLLGLGHYRAAIAAAKSLEQDRGGDPETLLRLGDIYARTLRYDAALKCYGEAGALDPANSSLAKKMVSANLALGRLDAAEAGLDALLRRDQQRAEAQYLRSTLRRWTSQNNHLRELELVLADASPQDEPFLCYALAKELEDVGEWQRGFAYLRRGADSQRRQLRYDPAAELAQIEETIAVFGRDFAAGTNEGYGEAAPVFVLGMPRSGTTLADRIVSSHSQVASIGEAKEFGRAIEACVLGATGRAVATAQKARQLPPSVLGREYARATGELLPHYPHLLDKTPRNFLFIGLILKALPNAKIIHMGRAPMDACYAIYKTLFREAWNFSYDLEELGRYYAAYRRLMAHWHKVFPGRILDVSYENLVTHQEAETRRMLAFCDLTWEEACLCFEKNPGPSLTASAAGVRQPIYKTSVELWRRYEAELAPLRRVLEGEGLLIEAPANPL